MTRWVYKQMHHALVALLDHGIRTVDEVGVEFTKERLCNLIRSEAKGVECFVMAEDVAKLRPKPGDAVFNGEIYFAVDAPLDDAWIDFHFFGHCANGSPTPCYWNGLARVVSRCGDAFPWPVRAES